MIRKMLLNDFASVYKLGNTLDSKYSQLYNLDNIINDNNQRVYVYVINNTVVGFINLTISFDEADIIDIIVDSKFRHQLIGTNLIKYAKEQNDLRKINLEVRESNEGAIKFYQQLGFKSARIIKNYYGSENAILMIKEIK